MGEHRQHHLVRLLVLELARSLEKGRHQLERALDRQLDLELRAAEDALGRVETVRTLHLVEHRRLAIARAAGSEQLGRDAKDLRHRPVRLLASASLGIGKLDQARLQEHPDMKVEVTRIDAEPLRELAVGELPVPLLAEDVPALSQRRCVWEEGRDVAVGPDAEQQQIELRVAELALVLGGSLLLAELAPDPVDCPRPALEPVEERTFRHSVVRVLVIGRHAALVAPPELDGLPIGCALRRFLVRLLGRLSARQDDVAAFACCTREPFGDDRRNFPVVLEDDELDVGHCSPAASSFDLSIAAWMALRNAARTPACSSSRIARIVVPPGEVTASRSSTGCIFSSRSSFAVPSIVWTTSCVEVSRPSPSRIPASIIASASSAK